MMSCVCCVVYVIAQGSCSGGKSICAKKFSVQRGSQDLCRRDRDRLLNSGGEKSPS